MFNRKQKALSGNSELNNSLNYSRFITFNSTPKRGVRQWITTTLTDLGSRAKRHQTSQIGSIRSVTLMQPPRAEFKRTYAMKSGASKFTERS